ncbi:MAG: hypothetical protein A2722_01390 [Candidatus Doudnabacteria bacterium RIFCSPHIGHO2_01_FULL_50_11]|uniref:Glycosyltransferase RgtA/B/C/D-like domain-containing protein n=1 Tax=Candidatus Doudnabacteria bacterium RIFCSPHIGHO2_01_FULL_50_11 TaxID=1817828 RepID=A0A1F5PH90_9BACT|nr:MAG: hypothetical protein A2722_01390 [Candidatus Doudnabacteria bacterium RIFCSPHIGHO2_01_FULL_50_11]HLC44821.1 glycosyltransferase family 39 protein [Patescibacteria group bacterium]
MTLAENLATHRRLWVSGILLTQFLLGLFTMTGDSAIVDEIAHIPAGYSYVAYHDYRLNPEHPPLLKDLAGLPLLLLPLEFPIDHPTWTTDVNGQWEAGWNFLYHYGNPADLLIFLARLPLLLLSVAFGFVLYLMAARWFGVHVALLSLFFYSLSPNFLAHSHFVTTDMGIAAMTFLSLATFVNFLIAPTYRSLGWATLALAAAEVTKFSAILLYPFYGLILLVYLLVAKAPSTLRFGLQLPKRGFVARTVPFLLSFAILSAGSLVVVWAFYAIHTYNFPVDKQIELIQTSLPDPRAAPIRNVLVALTSHSFFAPLAQYLLGVAMVFSRVAGGNTTYFLGAVTNQSFKWYFPATYLLKEPLGLIILLFTGLWLTIRDIGRAQIRYWFQRLVKYIRLNPHKTIFISFIVYYSGISISGNLNLGIRHLFPILPLAYVLISQKTLDFLSRFRTDTGRKIGSVFVGLMIFWFGMSSLLSFPHYLGYFNELVGSANGGWYFTDSNVDWGQDLKRLVTWVQEHPEVDKIKVDYFGGGEPKYYFCERKFDANNALIKSSAGYNCNNSVYQEYHVNDGPVKGWVAVSVTFLQNAKFYHDKFGQQDYDWLRFQTPVAKVGNSIWVYHVE